MFSHRIVEFSFYKFHLNLVPRVLSLRRESTISREREDPGNEVDFICLFKIDHDGKKSPHLVPGLGLLTNFQEEDNKLQGKVMKLNGNVLFLSLSANDIDNPSAHLTNILSYRYIRNYNKNNLPVENSLLKKLLNLWKKKKSI